MYRTLDPEKIVATLATLERRVAERFPNAGLTQVAAEMTRIAREAHDRSLALERPNYGLRLLTGLVVSAGLAGIALLTRYVYGLPATTELFGMVQGIDAGVNLLLLVGGATFFLTTLEGRIKRRTALRQLHELRSIVHVVDMHQLTKDPSIMLGQGARTSHSPQRAMSPFELTRYLDYCSEMLSLAAKIAALYAQSSTDTEVIEVVNDIERLTTNLSSKIWQKITLVEPMSRHAAASALQATSLAQFAPPAMPEMAGEPVAPAMGRPGA